MDAEPAETVLEQRVRTLEIAAQPARRGGAVLAGERLRARGAEELPVHADQERGGDPARRASRSPPPRARRSAPARRAPSPRAPSPAAPATPRACARRSRTRGWTRRAHSADLQTTERGEDRLARRAATGSPRRAPRALGNLVEEEIFLRREVVEDGLLRDAGLGGDLGDRDLVEAALDEQAHRHVGDLLPRRQLLRLPQAHTRIVTPLRYCYGNFSATV